MGRYLLRRLAISVPILLGISITTFALGNVAPGDPVTAMLDPKQMANLGPEWIEQRKEALGLNDPAAVRYVIWLSNSLAAISGIPTRMASRSGKRSRNGSGRLCR